MVNVEVVFDVVKGALLVPKLAPFTVGAEASLMELLALLAFVFVVNWLLFIHNFLCSVGELALRAIPTETLFDPVLAHLSLKLGLVNLVSVLVQCGSGFVLLRLLVTPLFVLVFGWDSGDIDTLLILRHLLDKVFLGKRSSLGSLEVRDV